MTLLKSEIKKAIKLANKVNGCNDATLTGYYYERDELSDFIRVFCEICHDYEGRAEHDVEIEIFLPDRRRSYAHAFVNGQYYTTHKY